MHSPSRLIVICTKGKEVSETTYTRINMIRIQLFYNSVYTFDGQRLKNKTMKYFTKNMFFFFLIEILQDLRVARIMFSTRIQNWN